VYWLMKLRSAAKLAKVNSRFLKRSSCSMGWGTRRSWKMNRIARTKVESPTAMAVPEVKPHVGSRLTQKRKPNRAPKANTAPSPSKCSRDRGGSGGRRRWHHSTPATPMGTLM